MLIYPWETPNFGEYPFFPDLCYAMTAGNAAGMGQVREHT
jgi:hypothetical protein